MWVYQRDAEHGVRWNLIEWLGPARIRTKSKNNFTSWPSRFVKRLIIVGRSSFEIAGWLSEGPPTLRLFSRQLPLPRYFRSWSIAAYHLRSSPDCAETFLCCTLETCRRFLTRLITETGSSSGKMCNHFHVPLYSSGLYITSWRSERTKIRYIGPSTGRGKWRAGGKSRGNPNTLGSRYSYGKWPRPHHWLVAQCWLEKSCILKGVEMSDFFTYKATDTGSKGIWQHWDGFRDIDDFVLLY